MDITLLVKSFFGLVVLLAILIFFLFYKPKKVLKTVKKKNYKVNTNESDYASIETILEVIKEKSSTEEELEKALHLLIKHHGTIHPKLGLRPHPDFNVYGEIVLRICRHPNTSTKIILDFDRALEKKNEEYKKDINDFLTKGLNSRGV